MTGDTQATWARPDVASPEDSEERIFVASQWLLMWWRFRRHRLALASMIVIIGIYTVAIFADFFAPFDPNAHNADYVLAPPQPIRFIDRTEGGLQFRPYIYALTAEQDPETYALHFVPDTEHKIPVGFSPRGRRTGCWACSRPAGTWLPRWSPRRRCSCWAPIAWGATC